MAPVLLFVVVRILRLNQATLMCVVLPPVVCVHLLVGRDMVFLAGHVCCLRVLQMVQCQQQNCSTALCFKASSYILAL